jgi:CheY-like chemotaxis protein
MEQVLMNLCVNARDAMPHGGRLSIELENVSFDDEYCATHTWAVPGRYVLLSVTDTGCGMDKDTIDQIFEPFFTTKDPDKGTGLGLATVYGIVQQHNGIIQVYSEVNSGTTFKIYLPIVEREASMARAKVVEKPRGGTETVLVAEDDEKVRKLVTWILEGAGYTVLAAANGREAVDIIQKHESCIDLILLDLVMPELNGRAVYESLQESHPNLKYLFSSGYSTNAVHSDFLSDKDKQLIQKPYSPGALLIKIREVLDSK